MDVSKTGEWLGTIFPPICTRIWCETKWNKQSKSIVTSLWTSLFIYSYILSSGSLCCCTNLKEVQLCQQSNREMNDHKSNDKEQADSLALVFAFCPRRGQGV